MRAIPADSRVRRGARRSPWAMAAVSIVLLAAACSPASVSDVHSEANLLDEEQRSLEIEGADAAVAGWTTQGNAAISLSDAAAVDGRRSLRVVASPDDPVYVDDTRTVRVATTPVVTVESASRLRGPGAGHVAHRTVAGPLRGPVVRSRR